LRLSQVPTELCQRFLLAFEFCHGSKSNAAMSLLGLFFSY
jgi:hypothetical protein